VHFLIKEPASTAFREQERSEKRTERSSDGSVPCGEPAHHGSTPRLGIGARIFSNLVLAFRRCSFSGRKRFHRLRDARVVI
jgi:hypothetical protein